MSDAAKPVSHRRLPAWAPLRLPLFRALWVALLASNIGTWMHDVGAAWLMTSLSQDARVNALVSTAGALPMFLLALPAGALADIIDRRKLMIVTQTWAFGVSGTLAGMTFVGAVTPSILLFFTLLMSIGSALAAPAWQAIIPELVKKAELSAAISLGGIAFNIARVLGPTLGGLLIGSLVPVIGKIEAHGAVFALNALSFSGVLFVLVRWKRKPRASDLPPEHIAGAIRTGLRYTRHSPELCAILIRLGGYILGASAMWAMLPLHARQNLGMDASGYGILLGFFGAGAVVAGLFFERLRTRFSSDVLVAVSSLGMALGFVGLSVASQAWMVRAIMFELGLAWPLAMLLFQVALLRNAPEWLRSRAASMFLLVLPAP
ncbi:MAG: MFS transporter [Armatimonadetes bacterium]|nr:MFS transporter [Armatimonadota bacterium]